jgi:hypothetical protein
MMPVRSSFPAGPCAKRKNSHKERKEHKGFAYVLSAFFSAEVAWAKSACGYSLGG